MEEKMVKLGPATFIGKEGEGIISFGSGQPDLPPPKEIYEMLPKFNRFKYGLIQGDENLRIALSKEYENSDKDNFVITNGASEALDLIFRVLGKNGGKVLVHKPYYYSYPKIIKAAGMEPIYTETLKGKIDIEDFKKKVVGCKAVLINSPSNPTGRVQDLETLRQIEKITQELNIPIVSDEVYKDLIYVRENYMLSGPHIITINSFSKTFAMCGFRVGYLYSNDKNLVQEVIDLKTHTSMNTSIISQEMAYTATKVPKDYLKNELRIWEERRNLICELLEEMGLEFWKPEGAFYVLPKVKNPEKMVRDLYEKHKVITYMGEWFGAPGRIRLSYALDKEKIIEGMRRIKEYLEAEGEI